MKRLELAVTVLGLLCMVVALGAFDWRLGLLVAGAFLTISAFDVPRTRA